MNAMFEKAVAGKKNGLETAFATGQAYYEFYKRHPKFFQMFLEAENLPESELAGLLRKGDTNATEFMKVNRENFETVFKAVVAGIKDGSIKPDLDPMLTSVFLIQSTKAMIHLPTGFEALLKQAGADKDATLKFTLQALASSLQRTQIEKTGGPEK